MPSEAPSAPAKDPQRTGSECRPAPEGNWDGPGHRYRGSVKQDPWLKIGKRPYKNIHRGTETIGAEKDPTDAAEGEGPQHLKQMPAEPIRLDPQQRSQLLDLLCENGSPNDQEPMEQSQATYFQAAPCHRPVSSQTQRSGITDDQVRETEFPNRFRVHLLKSLQSLVREAG